MAPPFTATHDRTHADYQHQWDTLVPQGYRPISLCVYGDHHDPRYAAVWVKRAGPAFAGIHGATAAQFQAFFDQWAIQGYSPTALSATGPAAAPVFAAVMEKSVTGASLTRHGLRSGPGNQTDTLEYWIAQARQYDWIPRCVATYGDPADRRFALVLDPNPTKALWSIAGWWGEDAAAYQARFNAQQEQWARPALVSVSADARYLSVFREDSIGPWVARHNLTSAGYQQEFNTWAAKGYFPVAVQAGGAGANARFAALFATQEGSLPRRFTRTGADVPAFAAVDAKIEQFMRSTGTRATGVAITYKGRLVFARGYTWGEADYPVTQPTSVFRVASCSKPITSILIHQLVQRGQLTLGSARGGVAGDTLQGVVGLKPPAGTTMDPRFANISIRHLLTHTAGWDRNKVAEFPSTEQAGAAFNLKSLPVGKERIGAYMAGQPLVFAPGTDQAYSNMGYLMLGLVIERRTGMPYEQAVRTHVLAPLGLGRPHVAKQSPALQPAGAARPHDIHPGWDSLRVQPSDVVGTPTGNRPLASIAFGGDFAAADAFGGWCMAPADYCKILAAFSRGEANPLLDVPTTNRMWSVPTDLYANVPNIAQKMPNYVSGWDSWTEPSGVRGFQHGGGLPGVSTRILYRNDGWGFAVFCNEAWNPDIYPELAAMAPSQWPQHDLFKSVGIDPFPPMPVAAPVRPVRRELEPAGGVVAPPDAYGPAPRRSAAVVVPEVAPDEGVPRPPEAR